MAAYKYYETSVRNFQGLKKLLSISQNHFTKLTFEASVTSGFEKVAKQEFIEKFGEKFYVYESIGRIFFNVSFDEYEKYRTLKCVDRVYVLVGFISVPFGGKNEDPNEDLTKIKNTANLFEWDKALTVWKEVFNFQGNIYPNKEEYLEAVLLKENSNGAKQSQEFERVFFQSENLYYEKTELEKALDSVIKSDSDEEVEADVIDFKTDLKKIPRFRVTCKRTGTNHSFSSQEAATAFGGYLQDKYNWIVDLSNYDLEIVLNICNENLYVGIALNKMSNHFRNIKYFNYTTLKSTVCANILLLCQIKVGDIVVDPMCGGGSIIIEGCINYPKGYFVGGDESLKAIEKTKGNMNSLERSKNIDCLNWDATHLPFKSNSVDVFVSDFPFGKRCGSQSNNKFLYKHALSELARVLRINSGRCVILTSDKKCLDLALNWTSEYWNIKEILTVNVGGLKAYCTVLSRTNEEFQLKLSNNEKKLLVKKKRLQKEKSKKSSESS